MTDTSQRVYRESEDGNLQRLPIVDTEQWPTASEVVAGLRSFLDQSESTQDLVLMRVNQARVLVERIDELASVLRTTADRIAGIVAQDAQDGAQSAEQPSGGVTTPPKG